MRSGVWALLLLLAHVGVSVTGGHSPVLHTEGHRQGRGVEGVGVLFERDSRSAIQCVAWCMSVARCTAVTFTSSPSPRCRGHAAVTTSTSASTSTSTSPSTSRSASASASTTVWLLPHQVWLEKNCSSNAQCGDFNNRECVDGLCLCSPGYYFSHSLNSCITGCAQENYHPKLLAYPGYLIRGYNLQCLKPTTPGSCLQACRQNADVRTCDMIDEGATYTCCLQTVTRHEVPASAWGTSEDITHFQKTCA